MPGGQGIFPTLTVGEHLKLATWLHRKEKQRVKDATARVLELNTGMSDSDIQQAFAQKLSVLGRQAATLTKTVSTDASGSQVALLTASYSYSIKIPFMTAYTGSYSKSANVFLHVPQ